MTSIRTCDPARAGAALPGLAPLPIGALVTGAAELLQQAAGLPAPVYVAVCDTQHISVQFAPARASVRAISTWARRFGSVTTSQPGKGESGTETWYRTQFEYCGIAVTAYAHIPADPASI